MPKLVIFDCDGVLVDSEVISNRVLAAILTDAGLPTTLEQARGAYQGLLLADVRAKAERQLGRALPQGWLEQFERDRAAAFRSELKPVDGAADAVAGLKRAGVSVCVASQGKPSKTSLSLSLAGLDRYFSEAVRFSAYSVAQGKPAPDLFLHAARAMGVEPPDCVVVEDTVSGVRAARAAGMRALGFAADADSAALAESGAEVFYALGDLPRLLGVG